jgi:hypothetical protein
MDRLGGVYIGSIMGRMGGVYAVNTIWRPEDIHIGSTLGWL